MACPFGLFVVSLDRLLNFNLSIFPLWILFFKWRIVFIEYFLRAGHFSKHFIIIYVFNPHNIESEYYQLYFIGEESERQMVECQGHPASSIL